jgi:hypothetical protein
MKAQDTVAIILIAITGPAVVALLVFGAYAGIASGIN